MQKKQEITEPYVSTYYHIGSPIKVRYKDNHAFIDNGREDKTFNIVKIFFAAIFWCISSIILANPIITLYNFIRKRVSLLNHTPNPK